MAYKVMYCKNPPRYQTLEEAIRVANAIAERHGYFFAIHEVPDCKIVMARPLIQTAVGLGCAVCACSLAPRHRKPHECARCGSRWTGRDGEAAKIVSDARRADTGN